MLPVPHTSHNRLWHLDALLPETNHPNVSRAKINRRGDRHVSPGEAIAAIAFSLFKLNQQNKGKRQLYSVPGNYYFEPEHSSDIDKAITTFYELKQENAALRNGTIYKNVVLEHICELGKLRNNDVVAVTKILREEEVLVVYNTSSCDAREKLILLNNNIQRQSKYLTSLYGYDSGSRVAIMQTSANNNVIRFINIYLKPQHLLILKILA